MNRIRHIFTLFLMLLGTTAMLAQGRVEAELDSVTIVIGGQVGLNIKASYPANLTPEYKQLSDTLTQDVEIVSASPIDTTVLNGIIQLEQRYIITSFDSGLHYIPPIEILNFGDGQTASTNNLAISVVNPFQDIQVDEETHSVPIFDVKDVKDSPFQFAELLQYLPWVIMLLVVVAVLIIAIHYYRKYKAKQSGEPVKPKHVDPCDVIALRELERIREEKLWQKNRFKEYYSDLTDTLRRYISERYSLNAMESTTDEIMESLAQVYSDTASTTKLRSVLETADFVKFAKHEPLPDENDTALKHAVEFVEQTRIAENPSQPTENKEDKSNNANS